MLGPRLFRRLFLAACALPVGCAAGLAADEAAERRELLGNITQGVIEFLCEAEGPYLGCLKIPAAQCRAELKPIGNLCQERMLGSMPEVSEGNLEAVRVFSQDFGRCLMATHLETGDLDRDRAGACLNMQ